MRNAKNGQQKTFLRPGVALIDELRLSKYRSFESARLVLGDLTVLIGRNGAGKSTLIDAFELIRDALGDSLENAIEGHGGIAAILQQGVSTKDAEFSLAVSLKLFDDFVFEIAEDMGVEMPELPHPIPSAPEVSVLYGFSVGKRRGGTGFAVTREVITVDDGQTYFDRQVENTTAPAFAREALALPILAGRDPLARAILSVLRGGVRAYCLSPMAIRAEPPIGHGSTLLYDGRNLGDVLKHIQGSKEDVEWVVRHLGGTTPGIIGLRASAAAGRRILQFTQEGHRGLPRRFGVHDMSDGTLRCLGILVALRQTPQPSLVCVDEIEDSIHPAGLGVLLDAVASSAERGQVLITSHSPEALSHPAVTAEKVRVVEWRRGTSEIFRLSPGAAELSRPPRSVGRLLRTNALFTAEEPERVERDFFEV